MNLPGRDLVHVCKRMIASLFAVAPCFDPVRHGDALCPLVAVLCDIFLIFACVCRTSSGGHDINTPFCYERRH